MTFSSPILHPDTAKAMGVERFSLKISAQLRRVARMEPGFEDTEFPYWLKVISLLSSLGISFFFFVIFLIFFSVQVHRRGLPFGAQQMDPSFRWIQGCTSGIIDIFLSDVIFTSFVYTLQIWCLLS